MTDLSKGIHLVDEDRNHVEVHTDRGEKNIEQLREYLEEWDLMEELTDA
jgi:hypothetical protein